MSTLVASKGSPPLGAMLTASALSSKTPVTVTWGQETCFTSQGVTAATTSSGTARLVLTSCKNDMLTGILHVALQVSCTAVQLFVRLHHPREDRGGPLAHLQPGPALLPGRARQVRVLPGLRAAARHLPGRGHCHRGGLRGVRAAGRLLGLALDAAGEGRPGRRVAVVRHDGRAPRGEVRAGLGAGGEPRQARVPRHRGQGEEGGERRGQVRGAARRQDG